MDASLHRRPATPASAPVDSGPVLGGGATSDTSHEAPREALEEAAQEGETSTFRDLPQRAPAILLDAFVALLLVVVIVRAPEATGPHVRITSVLVTGTLFALAYLLDAALDRSSFGDLGTPRVIRSAIRPSGLVTLTLLAAAWAALALVSVDAAYLLFPLFFLFVFRLGPTWGSIAVVAGAVSATVLLLSAYEFNVGLILGPAVGAGVALVVGNGLRLLAEQSAARQRLIEEITAARETAIRESRRAGQLAERERIVAEIHDTVAQGLSSIAMLLTAVQRAEPRHPDYDRIELARTTAVDNLAEARRIISALSPAPLDSMTLVAAAQRVCEALPTTGIAGEVVVDGEPRPLPAQVEATALRVIQGAVANAARHSGGTRVVVTLTYPDPAASVADESGERLRIDIVDNGRGFADGAVDGVGLTTMRRRVLDLGGSVTMETSSAGTGVAVVL